MHQEPGMGRRSRSAAPQAPAKEGTIDEVIAYLENPPQPDDPVMKAKIDKIVQVLPKEKKKKIGGTKKYYKHKQNQYSRRQTIRDIKINELMN